VSDQTPKTYVARPTEVEAMEYRNNLDVQPILAWVNAGLEEPLAEYRSYFNAPIYIEEENGEIATAVQGDVIVKYSSRDFQVMLSKEFSARFEERR
jgi:hypothetical protein